MTDRNDEAIRLWQSQPLEETTMSLQEVRARIAVLGKKVRRRNLIGGFACIVVILSFSRFFVTAPTTLLRVGAALTVLGSFYVAIQLIRRKLGAVGFDFSPMHAEAGLAFYRAQLEKQRDFYRGGWLWSRLLIFAPGPVVFLLGLASSDAADTRYVALEAIIFTLLLVAAIPLNRRAARGYQRELDALETER